MTTTVPYYLTISLFGKEHFQSVAAPDVFQQIVSTLATFFQCADCALACRGVLEGPRGKNIAPRKAALDAKSVERWKEQLASGVFKQFEIFDAAWSDQHFPGVYAGINKLWGFGSDGYSERTKYAAENNITVAVRDDLCSIEHMKDLARELSDMISAFYGFITPEVPWDRAKTPGGPREDMIDAWWYNRTSGDYRRGKYRMDEMIPRLYWGNILSSSHLRGGDPSSLPLSALNGVEKWDDHLFYVNFTKDPQSDVKFHESLEAYFNFVPS